THPGGDRDVDEFVRVTLVEARQDPDDDPARALGTAAHRFHNARQPTGDDDALALGDEATHGFGHAQGLLRDRILGVLRALADDRDEGWAGHGAASIGSRSR